MMTPQEQKQFLSATARFIAEEIAKAMEPLRERIAGLENEQKQYRFMGHWDESTEYLKNNQVEFGGSCWIALRDTRARPSTDCPRDWDLMAKRGRDAPRAERRAPTAATTMRHNV